MLLKYKTALLTILCPYRYAQLAVGTDSSPTSRRILVVNGVTAYEQSMRCLGGIQYHCYYYVGEIFSSVVNNKRRGMSE